MVRRNRSYPSAMSQPDLFAFAAFAGASKPAQRLAPKVDEPNAKPQSAPKVVPGSNPASVRKLPVRIAREAVVSRITTVSDMPAYSESDQELVDRSISALPPNRMWFTYAAIRESFGISRATVARKVKLGLVPGIRFTGVSVVEDGPVRRFDRAQLRWLLLAVRSRL